MRILILVPAVILLVAITAPAEAQPGQTLPHTLVYKAKADYSKLVSVELSEDGKRVASYPAPTDVTNATAPVKLANKYWLSKAGISLRTAFLKVTVKEYSQRKEVSAADLYKEVKIKSPLVELWDCGTGRELTATQINGLIRKKKLASKCKQLK